MEHDFSGQRLGKYILQRVLGRGGMGEVYEALDPETGRTVAIKVLPTSLSAQPGYLERFNQELKLAASLEHIHILPIYDHGSQDGTTYIVMRYLTGSDLQKRLHKLGRPSTRDARRLLHQIGLALDYAHKRGVVHRDLKPNNIMFDDEGNAYLGDFGIAKVVGTGSGLTGTGQVIGTPYYMAPEQVKADEIDTRADIYSLGIIAFQLLTGELPFDAPTPYALMYKHLNNTPPRPTDIQDNLDPYVDEVIFHALAKDPNDRYQTARELVEDLDNALSDIPDSEQDTGFMTVQVDTADSEHTYTPARTPKSGKSRSVGRLILTLVGLLGAIAIAVAAMLLIGDEDSPSPTSTSDVGAQITDTLEPSATEPLSATGAPTLSGTDIELSVTSDIGVIVEERTSTFVAGQTQTATLWTPTPTVDTRATANARLTVTSLQEIALNQTETATLWTATPTETETPTSTYTPSPNVTETFVAVSTNNAFATETQSIIDATATATLWTDTPTATSTPTHTPAPTDTREPSLGGGGDLIAIKAGSCDVALVDVESAEIASKFTFCDVNYTSEYYEWLQDGSQLVISEFYTGKLYFFSPDENDLRSIPARQYLSGLAISPDGTQFAATYRGDVVITDLNGEIQQTLVEDFTASSPSWSPDGEHIVFRGSPSAGAGLFVLSLETGEVDRLTVGHHSCPVYSPDGTQIMYLNSFTAVNPYVSNQGDIFVIDIDGGNPRNLTSSDNIIEWCGTWSPDGEWIAFMSNRSSSGRYYSLFIMDKTGQNVRRLAENPCFQCNTPPEWQP